MTAKDAKLEFIINVALKLFSEKSISEVTVKDVAKEAGVGEATVYRYFTGKKNLVKAAAERLQKSVYESYFRNLSGKNGYEKCETFFGCYRKIFEETPSYYRFVKFFDAFMISEGGQSDEYSAGVELFKNVFLSAYKMGLTDKSVRDVGDGETFYFTAAHAMLETAKKLSAGGAVVKQDETTDSVAEISKLQEIILFYLRPQA